MFIQIFKIEKNAIDVNNYVYFKIKLDIISNFVEKFQVNIVW